MTSEKLLRIAFVIVSLSLLWCLIRIDMYRAEIEENNVVFIQGGDIGKAQTIDSLQNLVDSLYAENYPCQIELNRFQIAYQIFLERNPKAASQYGDIISNETE